MAVGTVFGIGGPSVISRAMGEGRQEYAGKVCSFCMWSCVGVGIVMSLLFLVFHWNITGAAIATVIGNVVGAGYYIAYFVRGKSTRSISLKKFSVKDNIASGVLIIGVPAALGSLLMSVSSIIMNAQMTRYGDMALAAVGVAMKVTMMTGMVCIGLGQGIQPLLGYCVGAKKWDRYKSALRFSLVFAFALSTVLTVLCYIFTGQIVSMFLTDTAAFSYGVSFSRILLCTSFLFGVFYVIINALQACGAATESFIVNISRQGIIYIPAMFLLGSLFHETGLIWAQPVADVLSLVLAVLLYIRKSKTLR